jgi:hypothetical protein
MDGLWRSDSSAPADPGTIPPELALTPSNLAHSAKAMPLPGTAAPYDRLKCCVAGSGTPYQCCLEGDPTVVFAAG